MYYTFFFNVDAVVRQNNGQFQVWELNIWQFIVIVEIKYFLNLNEYYLTIFILSIHYRQISFFKITKDIQSKNNNNIVLSMLYSEICPKDRRHNARPRHITWTTQYYCMNIITSRFGFMPFQQYFSYILAEETANLPQVTDKLYHIMLGHLALTEIRTRNISGDRHWLHR
jgi:hypothetical protein